MSDFKHCDNDNPDETNPETAPFVTTSETTGDELLAAWNAGTIDFAGMYMLASLGYPPAEEAMQETAWGSSKPKTGRSDVWWSRLREYITTTRSIAERRNAVISEHVVLKHVLDMMNDIEGGSL